jgi:hypothetical protein
MATNSATPRTDLINIYFELQVKEAQLNLHGPHYSHIEPTFGAPTIVHNTARAAKAASDRLKYVLQLLEFLREVMNGSQYHEIPVDFDVETLRRKLGPLPCQYLITRNSDFEFSNYNVNTIIAMNAKNPKPNLILSQAVQSFREAIARAIRTMASNTVDTTSACFFRNSPHCWWRQVVNKLRLHHRTFGCQIHRVHRLFIIEADIQSIIGDYVVDFDNWNQRSWPGVGL